MLTKKQYELLMVIEKGLRDRGVPPSYDEMTKELGLSSKSGIHRLIKALEERGFIRRIPNRARAIDVVRLPDDITSPDELAKRRASSRRQDATSGFLRVPCLPKSDGAARPDIHVPVSLVGGKIGSYIAMVVEGEGIKTAGISAGDIVVADTDVSGLSDGSLVLASQGGKTRLMQVVKNGNNFRLSGGAGNQHLVGDCKVIGSVAAMMRSMR